MSTVELNEKNSPTFERAAAQAKALDMKAVHAKQENKAAAAG